MFNSLEWIFLVFFLFINGTYLVLNASALITVVRQSRFRFDQKMDSTTEKILPPTTILVPAYNERTHIVETLRSLMALDYPDYEIIVINDGSTDGTLKRLSEAFGLEASADVYEETLPTETVHSILRSTKLPNLRVIDKENGGKADSLNAGINLAKSPYVTCIDADTMVESKALKALVRPFLMDSRTVAVGGTVRVANGCEIVDGHVEKVHLPKDFLPMLQVLEYLRAFLLGRLGWTPYNGLLIISGALGMFNRKAVVEAGGYHTDNIGEDMELVVRMHRVLSEENRDYRVQFLPDPICWTEVPRDFNTLRNQRMRWQQGLGQSLLKNLGLLFKSGSGFAGWFAFPFFLIFEWVGAGIEVLGYCYVATSFLTGTLNPFFLGAFLCVSIGLGILVSTTAFLIESISFNVYEEPGDFLLLFLVAVVENFGYRQVNNLWRFYGFLKNLRGGEGQWGKMVRYGFQDQENQSAEPRK